MIELVVVALAAVVGLVVRERDHDRAHAQWRAYADRERQEFIALTDRLLQRIQAPEQAVMDHSVTQVPFPLPEAVNPESDTEFWESQLTKEQLADALMAQERMAHEPS